MNQLELPIKAGEKVYYSLPEIYNTSLTLVSYLSNDAKVGGKYEDLFSPSVCSISEKNGIAGLVSKFLIKNFPDEDISRNKNFSLKDKIEFLAIEGYSVASIFKTKNDPQMYSAQEQENSKNVGGIITSRMGTEKLQAEMYTKELNGDPFVFSVLYQTTKENPNDLSCPLYAVAGFEEIKEAAIQLELRESKSLVKKDWHNLENISQECRKNCWLDAVSQDARAFEFAPDDIKGNRWAIQSALKKTNHPEIILKFAKKGDVLLAVCDSLLKRNTISFEQIPDELKANPRLIKYNVKPSTHNIVHQRNKDKDLGLEIL